MTQDHTKIIKMLARAYPRCFFENARLRQPLKTNIVADIPADEFPDVNVGAAIDWYCTHIGYHLACSEAGGKRIDLNGDECGTVTEAEAECAQRRVAEIRNRRRPNGLAPGIDITRMSEQEILDYLKHKKEEEAAAFQEKRPQIKADLDRYCREKWKVPLSMVFENYDRELFTTPVGDLDFGGSAVRNGRIIACLRRNGINTVADLVVQKQRDLAVLGNMGAESVEAIKAVLSNLGLRLGMTVPDFEN